MSHSPELERKIEGYAAGRLSPRELHDFEAELERNPELKREAMFKKTVVDAIVEARVAELKNHIFSQANVKLASNPWGKVWTIASVVIVGSALAFYFLDSNGYFNIKKEEKPEVKSQSPPPVPVAPVVTENNVEPTDTVTTTPVEPGNTVDSIVVKENNPVIEKKIPPVAAETTYADTDEEGQEIVVKRDQLLATINLKAIDKSRDTTSREDLSSSTIEKLNPEAKLPEPAPTQEMFRVELWKSPINFKGYRFLKNRLTLFGVEQHVVLRIYKLDEYFYLEYEPGTFSRLYPGDQFNAFVKVRDPEIIGRLSQ